MPVRRSFRSTALVAAMLAALAFSTPATAAPPDQLSGTLRTIISETPGVDASLREFAALELPNGRVVELRVSPNAKLPPPGSRVRVSGRATPTAFEAEGGVATLAAPDPGQVELEASTTKRVAVLLANFVSDPRVPWTLDQVRSSLFSTASGARSVSTFFGEQSHDDWSVSGDVFGYYTLPYADRSTCDWSAWHASARAAATSAGVDLSSYTNVMVIWPGQSSCDWAGIAYVPGSYSALNNTIGWSTATHELGHNFGTSHAQSISCVDGLGVRVTLSNTCSISEYGDPFSRMGTGLTHFNNVQRKRVGHLSPADQLTVTASGAYTVGVAAYATTDGPKIVRVARGDGSYLYLEFRQTYGLFEAFGSSNATSGVLVRIGPDVSNARTQLLDMNPQSSSLTDAALTVDRSFSDPVSGVTIQTLSVSGSGARVEISLPGSDPPPSSTPTPTPSPTTPLPPPPGSVSFSDISTSPFKDDIEWIAARGITNGCGDGRFCPDDWVTRDQMASFLVRALGLPASASDYFSDDVGNQHAANINALAAAGITRGCGPSSYCPADVVTREQMASFLVRAFGLAATATDSFGDDAFSPHAADINALAASGITRGCGPSSYCPAGTVTRGQMAAFLRRALDR